MYRRQRKGGWPRGKERVDDVTSAPRVEWLSIDAHGQVESTRAGKPETHNFGVCLSVCLSVDLPLRLSVSLQLRFVGLSGRHHAMTGNEKVAGVDGVDGVDGVATRLTLDGRGAESSGRALLSFFPTPHPRLHVHGLTFADPFADPFTDPFTDQAFSGKRSLFFDGLRIT
jgi:hypothetical protein